MFCSQCFGLTCVGGVSGQPALVQTLQEEPAHSAARPASDHPSYDVVEAEEGNSAPRGQVCQDKAGLLQVSLDDTQQSQT